MYTAMHCAICQKNFATKFTYEHHIQMKHRPEEEIEDQESDNDRPDIFEYSQSGNESSGESMEQTDNGSETEEEEEPDFWTLIIRNAVGQIQDVQKVDGKPDFNWLQHITEKPLLSQFINLLRKTYYNTKLIHEAGSSDSLLEKIENELEKLKEEYTDEDFESEAQETAWKKYKPYIKKKILQNINEFETVVCKPDADDEGVSENDSLSE